MKREKEFPEFLLSCLSYMLSAAYSKRKEKKIKERRKKDSTSNCIEIVIVSAIQPALHTTGITGKCHGNFFLENPDAFNFKHLPSDQHIFVSKFVRSGNGSERAYAMNEGRKSK